jgi:hypothetical protein
MQLWKMVNSRTARATALYSVVIRASHVSSPAHLHEEIADQATRVPDMPYTVSTDTGAYNFDGSPKPWSDVIEKISLRFPRPLLGENPFHSAPAESWQAAKERAELASEAPGAPGARGGGGLGHR